MLPRHARGRGCLMLFICQYTVQKVRHAFTSQYHSIRSCPHQSCRAPSQVSLLHSSYLDTCCKFTSLERILERECWFDFPSFYVPWSALYRKEGQKRVFRHDKPTSTRRMLNLPSKSHSAFAPWSQAHHPRGSISLITKVLTKSFLGFPLGPSSRNRSAENASFNFSPLAP